MCCVFKEKNLTLNFSVTFAIFHFTKAALHFCVCLKTNVWCFFLNILKYCREIKKALTGETENQSNKKNDTCHYMVYSFFLDDLAGDIVTELCSALTH